MEPYHAPEPQTPQNSVESVAEALDRIDRILHQMLLLAEVSASDLNTDRDRLQKVLERLQKKIDRIADSISQQETDA